MNARPIDELTQQERDIATRAYTHLHGMPPDFGFAPDRAWIEGFAAAITFESTREVKAESAAPAGVDGLPLKMRPDFMAGYDAGMKDGKAIMQRKLHPFEPALAAAPKAPAAAQEATHDWPACAVFRGGKCTCDAKDDVPGGQS